MGHKVLSQQENLKDTDTVDRQRATVFSSRVLQSQSINTNAAMKKNVFFPGKKTQTSAVKTRVLAYPNSKNNRRTVTESVNSPLLEMDDDRTALMDFLSNMVGE